MNKAVFLDRDGVINTERGFTYKLSDFQLLPGLADALKVLMDRGYLLIVISNQSGIAQKLYEQKDVEILHAYLRNELKKEGVLFTEIYYCMHHPTVSNCICRKPDSQMIEKAMARFDVNSQSSFFIGDKERDIRAAKKAGVEGILIEANTPLREILHLIP